MKNNKKSVPTFIQAYILGQVFRIRIRRIHKFLGLLDTDLDFLVKGTDPDSDADPSTLSKNRQKSWFTLFCNFFMTFYLWRMMQMYLQKVMSKKLEENNFVDVFRITDEKSRIRIRTIMSRIQNTASVSGYNSCDRVPLKNTPIKGNVQNSKDVSVIMQNCVYWHRTCPDSGDLH